MTAVPYDDEKTACLHLPGFPVLTPRSPENPGWSGPSVPLANAITAGTS
jgi:hypothetical protein